MGKKGIIAMVALVLFVATMVAADELLLRWAVGGTSGTYWKFAKQIEEACPGKVDFGEVPDGNGGVKYLYAETSGSGENLKRLTKNIVSMAFVQSDTLFMAEVGEGNKLIRDQVRTFMMLYPEEVHMVALKGASFSKFSQLGGRRVGVWGGSKDTLEWLRSRTGIMPVLNVVEGIPAQKKAPVDVAFDLLNQGRIDMVFAVGGQPLGSMEALPKNTYKLIEFDLMRKEVLEAGYEPTQLTEYTNFVNSGVRTIAVQAMIVTRNYKSAKMMQPVLALRKCVVDKYDEIRETPGNHAKWEMVRLDTKGPWPYFEGAAVKPVKSGKQLPPGGNPPGRKQ